MVTRYKSYVHYQVICLIPLILHTIDVVHLEERQEIMFSRFLLVHKKIVLHKGSIRTMDISVH